MKMISTLLSVLLFFGTLESSFAQAGDKNLEYRQRVVLLTAFRSSDFQSGLTPSRIEKEGQIEAIFREKFAGSGIDVVVYHRAEQHRLWAELHRPNTVGLFWISHGGKVKSLVPTLRDEEILADAQGVDVKSIFHEIHPNLRFLGVVGCHSGMLRDVLASKEAHLRNPSLLWTVNDGCVFDVPALKKALKIGASVLSRKDVASGYPCSPCLIKKGFPLDVTRSFTQVVGSGTVRIENEGKILGVFPKPRFRQVSQTLRVYIPFKEPNQDTGASFEEPTQNFDLTFISGFLSGQDLGRFDFSRPWKGALWKLFTLMIPDKNNKHIFREESGVRTHFYEYFLEDSAGDRVRTPVSYQPFACSKMPPRGLDAPASWR